MSRNITEVSVSKLSEGCKLKHYYRDDGYNLDDGSKGIPQIGPLPHLNKF